MKYILSLIIMATFLAAASAQDYNTGLFSVSADIGNPAIKGSSSWDKNEQAYTLSGSGYNIWFARDEFHFLYNKIKGDFILTADFAFSGKGKEAHRKTGWMIRASEKDNSPHISATLHGDGLTVLQWRGSEGAEMRDPQDQLFAPDSVYDILQLERAGNVITMRAARRGEPFVVIGSHAMDNLPGEVLAGLFICSHNPANKEEAKAWNIRIDKPVPDNYNAGQSGYVGCRLETMDVFTGLRKVIYEKNGRFEAPNWMPDGKKLLFNMDGLLWKIPVGGGDIEKLNTGSATRNNNDHGISFDGKLLAISSSIAGGGSAVHVLPLEGGEPKLVTDKTPSYWHGWDPDNRHVVYVAMRDGKKTYDIYRKPIDGGPEVALTNTKTGQHVDGCEYSPDGKFIYFNGNFSDRMQLWRMKPDGTGMEQLTYDIYNNWFPHISPDGKWIAFISFPPDIDPNSHPSYKRCMLRLMPVDGGEPKVIAFLYGGQGTINVPSWSPDSRQIAFVSNSGK
jgi:hypothetical protein